MPAHRVAGARPAPAPASVVPVLRDLAPGDDATRCALLPMKQTSDPPTSHVSVTGSRSASSWAQRAWSPSRAAAVAIPPTNSDHRSFASARIAK
jgi:hypothetical protein